MPRPHQKPTRKFLSAAVLLGFDHVAAHPLRRDDACATHTLLDQLIQAAVGFDWYQWPDAAMRAVLAAYLEHAPYADLQVIADRTTSFLGWLKDYETECAA